METIEKIAFKSNSSKADRMLFEFIYKMKGSIFCDSSFLKELDHDIYLAELDPEKDSFELFITTNYGQYSTSFSA